MLFVLLFQRHKRRYAWWGRRLEALRELAQDKKRRRKEEREAQHRRRQLRKREKEEARRQRRRDQRSKEEDERAKRRRERRWERRREEPAAVSQQTQSEAGPSALFPSAAGASAPVRSAGPEQVEAEETLFAPVSGPSSADPVLSGNDLRLWIRRRREEAEAETRRTTSDKSSDDEWSPAPPRIKSAWKVGPNTVTVFGRNPVETCPRSCEYRPVIRSFHGLAKRIGKARAKKVREHETANKMRVYNGQLPEGLETDALIELYREEYLRERAMQDRHLN